MPSPPHDRLPLVLEPFIITLCGPRKSGKSFFVSTLLDNGLIDRFDKIYILCSSLNYNDDYYEYFDHPKIECICDYDDNTILDIVSTQERRKHRAKAHERGQMYPRNVMRSGAEKIRRVIALEELKKTKRRKYKKRPSLLDDLRDRQLGQHMFTRRRSRKVPMEHSLDCPNILLICDDCIDSGILRYGTTLEQVAARGRHYNMSVIICSQRINAINTTIRDNSDYVFILKPGSISECERFLDQFVSRNHRRTWREQVMDLFDHEYLFIYIDNIEPRVRSRIKMSRAQEFAVGDVQVVELPDA